MRWLDCITDLKCMNLNTLYGRLSRTEEPGKVQPVGWQRIVQDLASKQQHPRTIFISLDLE